MRVSSVLFLAALSGCTDKGTVLPLQDVDEDGFYSDVDCNDQDPLISPAAAELCDGIDNDCDGEADEDDAVEAVLWFPDNDGDGYGDSLGPIGGCEAPGDNYVDNSDDCDDEDADRNPGNTEVCDDLDNDCDGLQDEDSAADAQVYYRDYDGDGFGNPYITVLQCYPDDDYVDNDNDCDDTNPDVYPGAEEICDGELALDNDCDGFIDDEDDTRVGGTTWYYDSDGDGFGNPKVAYESCAAPTDYVADDTDCNDGEIGINPDAEEVCGDGVDNNCDDLIDTEDADAREVGWYVDGDGDGYGDPDSYWGEGCDVPSGLASNDDDCDDDDAAISPAGAEVWYDGVDADCDGADDFDADGDGSVSEDYGGGDCDDADEAVSELAIEVCGDGVDNDCDTRVDACSIDAVLVGEVFEDEAGVSMTAPGDLDGDGVADLVVGAPYHDSAGSGAGAAYVMTGAVSGSVSLADGIRIDGLDYGDAAGSSLGAPGDVDGDGYDDLLVGAWRADASISEVGGAYLLAGPITADASTADAMATFLGEAKGDAAGWAMDSGDFDGDGVVDLLVSAVDETTGGGAAGAAYLLAGPLTADTRLWSAELKLTGEDGGDAAGTSAAFAGDLDGDGSDELAVGAPNHNPDGDYEGAVYLIFAPEDGTASLSEADGIWTGEGGGDLVGTSVAAAGDLNGDGYDDVLVGAPGQDGAGDESGAAYLLLGPATSTTDLSEAAARLEGEGVEDFAGSAVAGIGDFNGDSVPDIAIGATGHDGGGSDAGAAYLIFGPVTGTTSLSEADAIVLGGGDGTLMGASITPAGDLDGDGRDDVLVGAPEGGTGTVSLLRGGGW